MIQDFLFPYSVNEAAALLAKYHGEAQIYAGGTDLILQEDKPKYAVDLSRIKDLDGIYQQDGFIIIGANTTHTQCAVNPLIKEQAPALAAACDFVGSTQIRNMGTLVGNVVSAAPAADSAIALAALGAVFVVQSADNRREVAIKDMYQGIGRSAIDSRSELVTQIKFPARAAAEGNAYERMQQRKGLSLPMLNAAVKIALNGNVISQAVIVAGPLAPGPSRIEAAEEFLIGKAPTEENFAKAGQLASQKVSFRSSAIRCSAEYRHEVLPVMIRQALSAAYSLASEA